jgi:hypothetical protein
LVNFEALLVLRANGPIYLSQITATEQAVDEVGDGGLPPDAREWNSAGS